MNSRRATSASLPTRLTAAAILLLLATTGCRLPSAAISPSQMGYGPMPISTPALKPGDELEINFIYTPELNTQQIIRPDGVISMPILGEVTAEGKTIDQLRQDLEQAYATQLESPQLTIIPRILQSWQVYVGGEVNNPQAVPLSGQMTVLEALMAAGGISWPEAEPRNVVVIRFHNGQRLGCALDMTHALAGKHTRPFYLQPNDIVYVPRSAIARVNQWVDQHINRILPQFGFTANTAGDFGISR